MLLLVVSHTLIITTIPLPIAIPIAPILVTKTAMLTTHNININISHHPQRTPLPPLLPLLPLSLP